MPKSCQRHRQRLSFRRSSFRKIQRELCPSSRNLIRCTVRAGQCGSACLDQGSGQLRARTWPTLTWWTGTRCPVVLLTRTISSAKVLALKQYAFFAEVFGSGGDNYTRKLWLKRKGWGYAQHDERQLKVPGALGEDVLATLVPTYGPELSC